MNTTKSQLSGYSPEEEETNFKKTLSLFISNWYWFAVSLFVSFCLAYGINRWSEKSYTVSSTMLIKDDRLGASSAGLTSIFPGSDAFKSQQNLNNEMGILKSYSLNYRVMNEMTDFHIICISVGKRGIAETRMFNNTPFVIFYDSLEKQALNVRVEIRIISNEKYILELNGRTGFKKELSFGEQFHEKGFDFNIKPRYNDKIYFDPKASNRYYYYFVSPASLANIYRGSLSVAPVNEDGTLVILSTTGTEPTQVADYLNKLMEVYIRQGLELKNQAAEKTIKFIDDQLSLISDSLSRVEGEMENFRLANRLIDLTQEGSNIQNKLNQIDNNRTALMLQKRYYLYLEDYIDSKVEWQDIVAPSVMGVTDPLLVKMVSDLSQLQLQKKQLALNINQSDGPLKLMDGNIVSAKAALAENVRNALENIDATIADTELRLHQVEASLDKLPSTERKMINIQRKYDLNNTVYTFLLEKKSEAGIARASNVADNRVIDYAGSYNTIMIKPKARQNLIIALLAGLLLPMACIYLIDNLNNKIIDKKDIEKGTGAPILGFISHNSLVTELPVSTNPGSTLSESFRSVRTNLKYFVKEMKCPVISVSSTIASEGKTFFAVNLASIFALSGKKILLVGLDLRKPRIHKILNLPNNSGLSNYLIGQEVYDNVIIKTGIDNLFYAMSGPQPPNPAELIESDEMVKFIERAKEEFDYIVIDTPPVAVVTDALLISQLTDFYIFVVRQRFSSKNTLELIEELYKNENIKKLGIVINDVSISGYYGYGLRYGYSFGYGSNYGYSYYSGSAYSRYGSSDSVKGYYNEES